jgi:hypothetical protein
MSLQRWPLGFNDSPSYAAPLTPWASFPAALTAEGQIRRPAELPHVSLIALGGLWRPLGGRQVLASRFINPVISQNTSEATIESIGPFPGGLVRANMRLELDVRAELSAISSSPRYIIARIGNGAAMNYAAQGQSSSNGTDRHARLVAPIDVLSDGSIAHRGGYHSFQTWDSLIRTPVVDFSQGWSMDLRGISVSETAVTITGATWSAGVATYTTSANHTLAVGDKDVISGITPSGYNGTFIVSAVGSPTTFSVPMAANPGTYTSGGSSSRISNVISQSYELALVG